MNQINDSIQCSVDTCAYHDRMQEYCTLHAIKVGCTAAQPKTCEWTECASFKARKGEHI